MALIFHRRSIYDSKTDSFSQKKERRATEDAAPWQGRPVGILDPYFALFNVHEDVIVHMREYNFLVWMLLILLVALIKVPTELITESLTHVTESLTHVTEFLTHADKQFPKFLIGDFSGENDDQLLIANG